MLTNRCATVELISYIAMTILQHMDKRFKLKHSSIKITTISWKIFTLFEKIKREGWTRLGNLSAYKCTASLIIWRHSPYMKIISIFLYNAFCKTRILINKKKFKLINKYGCYVRFNVYLHSVIHLNDYERYSNKRRHEIIRSVLWNNLFSVTADLV